MLRIMNKYNQKGSILIFSLWIVALLTVFVVQIGMRIRQRVTVLSRIETTASLRHVAASGVKKALSTLKLDFEKNNQVYTAYGKHFRHNNDSKFSNIVLPTGTARVFYKSSEGLSGGSAMRFGFVDEERKLNINTAEHSEIQRLIESVTEADVDKATDIANAIVSWREIGDVELIGFYSDDYYAQLPYPYEPRKIPFELIDELRLLRGVTEDIFQALFPYVTVYGNGKVNINTVSVPVLRALGLDDAVIDKLVAVRQGPDGMESTVDDYIFHKTFDVASEVAAFIDLDESEITQIDSLNRSQKIGTNSFFYTIESHATIPNQNDTLSAICTYNLRENRIEYWREK